MDAEPEIQVSSSQVIHLSRALLFFLLLGGSGWVSYRVFSPPSNNGDKPPAPIVSPRRPLLTVDSRSNRPLLLEQRERQQVDSTNHDVMVPDLALADRGSRIEQESLTRLQELTYRYQLSANQRRESFPLLVRYHPDYIDGLVVNGILTRAPGEVDFATSFAAILDLTQRELYQEDLVSDRAWWNEIINQIRYGIEGDPASAEPGDPSNPAPTRRPFGK